MTWDIDLHKVLRHRDTRFVVSARVASNARNIALLGPSGAGKTQTLRMVAGIARPDAGRVAIAGRVLFDSASALNLTPQSRRLGYVFQDYALFPHLTVRQNIAFGRHHGLLNPSRARDDGAVRRWLDAFHLAAISDHYPHQISGGQRQRTALARALVNDPTALLLDEPFAALDKGLRQRLRRELQDLQADLGIPTLLITHDDEDAAMLAADIVHMRAGEVVTDKGAFTEALDEQRA